MVFCGFDDFYLEHVVHLVFFTLFICFCSSGTFFSKQATIEKTERTTPPFIFGCSAFRNGFVTLYVQKGMPAAVCAANFLMLSRKNWIFILLATKKEAK